MSRGFENFFQNFFLEQCAGSFKCILFTFLMRLIYKKSAAANRRAFVTALRLFNHRSKDFCLKECELTVYPAFLICLMNDLTLLQTAHKKR